MNTHDRHHIAMGPTGFHPRLTVLKAGPHERPSLTEHLARLFKRAPADDTDEGTDPIQSLGPDELDNRAKELSERRVDDHTRTGRELAAARDAAEEAKAAAAERRDEAATRCRRMATHLEDCEDLLEDAQGLGPMVEEAAREVDQRRAELEEAGEKLAGVLDQRQSATAAIEDARAQLAELEASEKDEGTLRRRLEGIAHERREAEVAHANTLQAYQDLETRAYERNATREQIAHERAELAARIEAPLYDPDPLREALDAFDAEADLDRLDPVAESLLDEWLSTTAELSEPTPRAMPPSRAEIAQAEQQLGQIEGIIAELEATSRHSRLDPTARAEIEAAHEAVLAAEEALDQVGGHPDYEYQLEAARAGEQQVLAYYGYATYLDLVMAEPEPADTQSELMEALQARRQAEQNLASLWAAGESVPAAGEIQARRERIYREACDLLGCEAGEAIEELLGSHPTVPPARTRDLADVLAAYGVYATGVSVRDAAIDLLIGIEREVEARDELLREVERLDAELLALDDEEADEAGEGQELMQSAHAAAADVEAIDAEILAIEHELADHSADEERRIQRAAMADQLRVQVAAVSEALERSDDEYHQNVADADAAATAAQAHLEQITAAVDDAIHRLRTVAEALPPTLRPKPTDDPLAQLPLLHEALSGEVERAEAALAGATRDHDRAQAQIEQVQIELDGHAAEPTIDDVLLDDLYDAVGEMIGAAPTPAVLDDPFAFFDEQERTDLLDALADASGRRQVILLTDDPATLGWAISLPDDVGAVTGLPIDPDAEPVPAAFGPDHPAADPPGAIAPSSS